MAAEAADVQFGMTSLNYLSLLSRVQGGIRKAVHHDQLGSVWEGNKPGGVCATGCIPQDACRPNACASSNSTSLGSRYADSMESQLIRHDPQLPLHALLAFAIFLDVLDERKRWRLEPSSARHFGQADKYG